MRTSICLIGDLPPPFSGPEIAMQKLLRSRLREQYRIHHFSFGMNRANIDRGRVTPGKIIHFMYKLLRLHILLNRFHPDCVYYYFAQTRLGLIKDLLVTWVIRLRRRKIILHLRGGNFRRFYDLQPPIIRKFIRMNLKRGNKILVQSECLSEMFDGIISRDRIGILYNGLEPDEMTNGSESAETKDELIVFFLGQLSYAKGYFDLLLALPKIVSQVTNVRILLAGERIPLSAERNIHLHYISAMETRFEAVERARSIERDYSEYIQYLGVVDAATRAEVMARTDVFVLPTYSEGFSNAVLEAMGHGLPVITTPVGAHPDIFRETPDVLVPPGDPETLGRSIVRMLKDRPLRKEIGRYNRQQVNRQYNMDCVVAQFVQTIESVV